MAFRTVRGERYALMRWRRQWRGGFTLIELLVVLAIVATLMTLVAPRYFQQTERARETVLKHNLRSLREAIDQYRQDWGESPPSLDALVERRYLRDVPLDPLTQRRDTWIIEPDNDDGARIGDVRSGAPGRARDDTVYADW